MATEDARKLFVAGLPESMTEDVLRQLFEATGGKVVDVSLPRDRTTVRPRGFGFVTFASAEEASSARSALDGSLQAGRAISVRPFSSEPPRRAEGGPRTENTGGPSEDRTLYVGNLPYDVTQQEVMQLFSDNGAGPVARVHLPTGPDGRLRGFGFVTLVTVEAANSAIVALRSVDVRGRRLMVNIAHPKGASGGPGDRPRGGPPRGPGEGGGWGGEPRFDAPPPDGSDPNRGADARRARPGEEESEEEAKKKKKKRGGGGGSSGGSSGGTSQKKVRVNKQSWQNWDKDDDG